MAENVYLCGMADEHTDFYKGLAIYILPEGVTDYFDLVDFNEEPAQKDNQLYKKELHLYLCFPWTDSHLG